MAGLLRSVLARSMSHELAPRQEVQNDRFLRALKSRNFNCAPPSTATHTTVPHDHDSAHGGAVALCPGARGLAVATHTRRVSLRAGAAADNVAQAAAVRRQRVLTARPLLCGTLEALRAAVGVL